MINSVVLMGRLVADPEIRTTSSGIDVCSFTLAVDRNYVRAGEERQADFINCVAWRQNATFIQRYFAKGSMIAVTGSIQTRNYEDKNGNKRTAVEVLVDQASFCGSKAETGSVNRAPSAAPAQPAYSTAAASDFESIADDEDLPF